MRIILTNQIELESVTVPPGDHEVCLQSSTRGERLFVLCIQGREIAKRSKEEWQELGAEFVLGVC